MVSFGMASFSVPLVQQKVKALALMAALRPRRRMADNGLPC
jgi:hypothetical protein